MPGARQMTRKNLLRFAWAQYTERMMRGSYLRRFTIVAAASAALAMGGSLPAHAGCTTDVECKDARICEQGRCVYPPPQNTVARSISPSVATPPSPWPARVAASAAQPVAAARDRKMLVGVAFLSTFLGQATIGGSPDQQNDDRTPALDTAHGFSLSLGYNVIAGLSLGVAPQFFWNLNTNNLAFSASHYKSDMELDLMASIAYAYRVIPKLAIYAEVLPGYSISSYRYQFPNPIRGGGGVFWTDRARGFVIGFGGGAAYDITDMFFANLGVGYQLGYQSVPNHAVPPATDHARTQFLSIAVGGGLKF
jgi:hypothetical protein